MKTAIAMALLVASVAPAAALTTKYTSELEPYTTATKAATLTEKEVSLALAYISSNRSENEKRVFIRHLVK